MSTASEQERLARFELRRPEAVLLAELVSIAAYVEPELLREARVALAPALHASAEADLWFSPLTEGWSAAGFSLRPGVAELLRKRLGNNPQRDAAFELVKKMHAHLPAVLLQEKVAWLAALKGEAALGEIEEELGTALRALLADERRAQGVSRWATNALPRLPGFVQQSGTARLLAFAAAHRIGARWLVTDVDAPFPAGMGMLVPRPGGTERKVPVRLRRTRDGLEIAKPDQAGHELLAPETDPVLLELRWDEGQGAAYRVITVTPGKQVRIPEHVTRIGIRLVDGSRFELRRTPEDAGHIETSANDADALKQGCVRILWEGKEVTGYWITREHVATVALGGVPQNGRVQIQWGGQTLLGAEVAQNPERDCTILWVDGGPRHVRPLPLSPEEGAALPGRDLPWVSLSYRDGEQMIVRGVVRTNFRDGRYFPSRRHDEAGPGSPVMVDGKVVGHIGLELLNGGASVVCFAPDVGRALEGARTLPDLTRSLRACRENEAAMLFAALQSEKLVAVIGPRESGQRTVMAMALERLHDPKVDIAWVDMRSDASQSMVEHQLWRALVPPHGQPQARSSSADGWTDRRTLLRRRGRRAVAALVSPPVEELLELAKGIALQVAFADSPGLDTARDIPQSRTMGIVRLQDLNREQVALMAHEYPVRLDPEELDRLYEELGGVPALIHAALTEMGLGQVTLATVLDRKSEAFRNAFKREIEAIQKLAARMDLAKLLLDEPLEAGDPRVRELEAAGLFARARHASVSSSTVRAPFLRTLLERARPAAQSKRHSHRVYISYTHEDSALADWLKRQLEVAGHQLYDTRETSVGERWVNTSVDRLKRADFVILLISSNHLASNWLNQEINFLIKMRQDQDHSRILLVLMRKPNSLSSEWFSIRNTQHFTWNDDADSPELLSELLQAMEEEPRLPVMGMPVTPDDPVYILRKEEARVLWLATSPEGSIVTVMAPRRMGKTSLLLRYEKEATRTGKRVVHLNVAMLHKTSTIFNVMASRLLEVSPPPHLGRFFH